MLYVGGIINTGSTFGTLPFVGVGGPIAYLAALADSPFSDVALATTGAKAQANLSLTPNPAYGSVTVHLPAAPSPAALALLDGLGRVVRTATAPAGQDYPLELAGLAPGIYTVRVRAGEALATQKLVVE